jgi:hypothetical protein
MEVALYKLQPVGESWELDLDEYVGKLQFTSDGVVCQCDDPPFKSLLERVLERPLMQFTGAGADALEEFAYDSEAGLKVLQEQLFAYGLGVKSSS